MCAKPRTALSKSHPVRSAIDQQRPLSIFWTPTCARLEAEGRWADLVHMVEMWLREPEGLATLPTRWQACLARIFAFQGKPSEARELIRELQRKNLSDEEIRIALQLAAATLARKENDWATAVKLAEEAMESSLTLDNRHLHHDAVFAFAMALTEQGRVYLALDYFQQIRLQESATAYRRGLSALNEGWLLWDIGQPQAMKQVLPLIPEIYRPRCELALSFIDVESSLAGTWLATGLPKIVNDSPLEVEQIIVFLAEWWALHHGSKIENSWITDFLRRKLETPDKTKSPVDPQTRALMAASLSLFEGQAIHSPHTTDSGEPVTWRNQIDLLFLEILSKLRDHREEARSLYAEKLLPLMDRYRVSTPLIPTWDSLVSPRNAWARTLSMRLEIWNETATTNPRPVVCLRICRESLVFIKDGQTIEIELGKSPVSRRLLMILAGPAGKSVNKSELHRELTGNKYIPALHDSRLHKLLRRLQKQLEEKFNHKLWDMPGDNTVKTRVEILLEAE